MIIEHGVTGTIAAPRDQIWTVLSNFADLSWNPGITECHLIDDTVTGVGAIRIMTTPDGMIIYERLVELEPQTSLSYAFAGAPPIPVLTSRITVALTDAGGGATNVHWAGRFDVVSEDAADTTEHVNTELAWPALITGLAAELGVEVDLRSAVPSGVLN